ncbi:uncharacterized protein [Clytia hemisphaerica]|uniref:uncharacterized protein n=1 Tax=Clytia hemisphaerica TaxID=252671 RepID=UPI0034D4E207
MKQIIFAIFIMSMYDSINAECTLSRYNVDGHETSAIARIHDCTSSTMNGGCGAVEKEIEIARGKTVNIIYKNGQYIKAIFTGENVCFAWNQKSKSSSYWTEPSVSYKCKETCTASSSSLSYSSETYIGESIGSTSLYKSLKVIITMKSATGGGNGFSKSCPITKTGKSGNVDRVRIEVWDCIRSTRGSNACGGKPRKENILLRKGDGPIDLGYDVNDYPVLAQFYGDETCVSFRYYDKRNNRYECNEKCWSMHENDGRETEVYESDVICSTISCGGSLESLRFFVKSKGARPIIATPSLVITLLCFVLIKLIMV